MGVIDQFLQTFILYIDSGFGLDLSLFDSGLDRRLSTIEETGLWDNDMVKSSSERRLGWR